MAAEDDGAYRLPLDEAAVETYHRDGVVCLREMFSADDRARLAEGVERAVANPTRRNRTCHRDAVGHRFHYDAPMWGDAPEIDRVLAASPAGQAVARLMGSNHARYFYTSVFVRSAGTNKRTPWHQDQPYWAVRSRMACSLWIPLDPVGRGAALEMVRGSHRWKRAAAAPASAMFTDNAMAEPLPDIDAIRDSCDIVSWAMRPGDALVFHGMTVHGGCGALPKDRGMRTISIQWLGDDAVYWPRPFGADPDITPELEAAGLRPGAAVDVPLCPVLWP